MMTRLGEPTGTDPARDRIRERIRERRGGELRALDHLLLHSPPVADGWNALLGGIRTATTVPADVRELVILRIAVLNHADYEWWAHAPEAVRAGITPAQMTAVRVNTEDSVFSQAHRAALAFTNSMTERVSVDDRTFGALHEHFDERQIVELTAIAATYNMVSRFLVALDVRAPAAITDGGQAG